MGICRAERESGLLRASLISGTARGISIGERDLGRVTGLLSDCFGYRLGHESNILGRKLDWVFYHRYGERPYTEGLPTRKSVSIFIRNASDPCTPCTFLCRGCGDGSLRIGLTVMSPYGIDSELTAEAAAESVGDALGTRLEMEYAKRGLMWNGYIPAAVRRFSGPLLNLAMLDYLHRMSGVLSDFQYPPKPTK
jgi:hypothetical protein